MKTIALVGAGNIGSRHLQGITKVDTPVNVVVVDPNPEALETARDRVSEMGPGGRAKFTFIDHDKIGVDVIDILLICANSRIRKAVYDDFISKFEIKNVVFEKFLFPDLESYQEVRESLERRRIKAWVNCPRRMSPSYQKLRDLFSDEARVDLFVTGSNWGLGCNAIHYLDLFSFLTRSDRHQLCGDLLDDRILDSKRSGFVEFTGMLSGRSRENSIFHVESRGDGNDPIAVTVDTPNYHVIITEKAIGGGMVVFDRSSSSGGVRKPFRIPFQSELTHIFVDQILNGEEPSLTPFESSSILHETLLKVFLEKLRKVGGNEEIHSCPVT